MDGETPLIIVEVGRYDPLDFFKTCLTTFEKILLSLDKMEHNNLGNTECQIYFNVIYIQLRVTTKNRTKWKNRKCYPSKSCINIDFKSEKTVISDSRTALSVNILD